MSPSSAKSAPTAKPTAKPAAKPKPTGAAKPAGAAKAQPRRRLSVDERREQLIAVALELFSARPPEEVSIDDIAAAAGASRPLVYHYFPGKQAIYEESLRRAGHELAGRFEEPADGPLSERLARVMDRYLDFVAEHGPGFAALLRGGSVAASPGTNAVIDEVRQAAHDQILAHLALPDPSAGLRLTVRAWIANAEISALAWLADHRQPPREQVRLRLVQDFVAALVVTAAREPELAAALGGYLAEERPDTPTGTLVGSLAGLLAVPGLGQALGALLTGTGSPQTPDPPRQPV